MLIRPRIVGICLLASAAVACGGGTSTETSDPSEQPVSYNNVTATYATISYAPNSYIIGNAFRGWTDELHGKSVFGSGPGNLQGALYQCGFLHGENFDHCGWLNHTVVGGALDGRACDADCPNNGDRASHALFAATYTNGVVTPWSGGKKTRMDYSAGGCTNRRAYANVSPWRVPATPENPLDIVKDGKSLIWRYVSKDGHWALVLDTDRSRSELPNWYFVRSACLNLPEPGLSEPG